MRGQVDIQGTLIHALPATEQRYCEVPLDVYILEAVPVGLLDGIDASACESCSPNRSDKSEMRNVRTI